MELSRWLLAGVVALAPCTAVAGEPIDPTCEKTLPASAVSKASGVSVHLIGRDPHIGAGGDCNWAVSGNSMVLMLRLMYGGAPDVQTYRGVLKAQHPVDVAGVGDEALSAGDSIVVARKGQTVIALSAFGKPAGGPYLTIPQLEELARRALHLK